MKFLIALLFIGITTVTGQAQQLPIHLEKVLEISSDSARELVQVADARLDDDGTIFISDRLGCTVKKFAGNGTFIASFGKYGTGMEEFKGPLKVALGIDVVAVSDYLSPVVRIFDKSLNLAGFIRSQAFVSDIAIGANGRVYVSNLTAQPEGLLACFAPDGTLLQRFQSAVAEGNELFDSHCITIMNGTQLVVAYYYHNRIEVFDSAGGLHRTFRIPGLPDRAERKTVRGHELPSGRLIVDADADGRGNLLVLGGDFSEKPWRTVYLFNDAFRGVFHLPEKSGILSARGDQLMTREQSKTKAVLYRLRGMPRGGVR